MTASCSQCGSSLTHQRFAVLVIKNLSNLFRLATLDMKDRESSPILKRFAFVPHIVWGFALFVHYCLHAFYAPRLSSSDDLGISLEERIFFQGEVSTSLVELLESPMSVYNFLRRLFNGF